MDHTRQTSLWSRLIEVARRDYAVWFAGAAVIGMAIVAYIY